MRCRADVGVFMKQTLRRLFKLLGVACGAILLTLFLMPLVDSDSFSGEALAAQVDAHKGERKGVKGGQGQGGKTMGSQGHSKGVEAVIFADDEGEDDSDRPEWAQGNRDLNPHNQGGGQPEGSGIKKGDMFGDLWVVLRNPVTGLAILDDNGHVQPIIIDENGDPVTIQLTEDGEVPAEFEPFLQEVESGRLSIGRAPDKVTDHALEEVLTKLDNSTEVTLDAAGRLVIDGATIDSPLENLALYVALMTADPALVPYLEMLPGEPLVLAPSLLAGAADKTGEITIDLIAYQNVILGIAAMTPTDYYDYSEFDYSRDSTYSGDITYFVQYVEDGPVVPVTEPMLDAIFGGDSYLSSDGEGITDFTQASDDAVQVIEFVHTQIHTMY